jgi:hypothetical protein
VSEDVELGRIEIVYLVTDDSDPVIRVTLPDHQDIPLVVQLGMIDYARHTALAEIET